MTQAFPLQWPHGRPRTKAKRDSAFKVKPTQAFDELMDELTRFKALGAVISCNIPLRRDGTPYRDGLAELLDDPGVAIYFTRKKRLVCLCCDTYRRPWENVRALGLSVEALRSMQRHGADQVLDQAFEGFTALPPPGDAGQAQDADWWVVLGVAPNATEAAIRAAYKDQARKNGGTSVELNAARDAGLAALGAA